MDSITSPERHNVQLMRGQLEVMVDHAVIEPDRLFDIAERRNPRRAFLFVSKVLGRHIPARPSLMSASAQQLADGIPADLPGPVLVVGMAETAVGLGASVHRAFSTDRDDVVYLTSTRHPLGTELFTRFEEEHSHASAHLIHMPQDDTLRALMLNARSLVMVDDEASTGKTFINLYQALVNAGLKHVERVVTCVLTDWSSGSVGESIGVPVSQTSLLQGRYQFIEDPEAPLPEMPEVATVSAGEWPVRPDNDWGRLGTRNVNDTLAPGLQVRPGERVLVVGTGEFVWRPFLLAERLEREGADVFFSSTTRSPIARGHAIKHALAFTDNYGLGIPNYLYNVRPGEFDRVLICSETSAQAVSRELTEILQAEVIVDAG
ncbi:MAG: phosphoribosyltransferase [Oceanospirillales bacterium]|uniref:Phosphoribosyltransferase-like predicted ribonucleoside biosynthesis protein n=1 Tax=Marinobacterium halophilum TaxID=267374 RepID=A0A2P8EYM8_9GAMM|nr:phosphoribosyltransferase domain-containing protein [Marinobacterium halophilum]MBR9828596.1 phosphoribosyltransferase [Oceanospirillales bacterium]PSL14568.1 phosphoribosyltransferase-like predicted ribonucleoside biosynthesis protein [Marinobacterium halophilum]